MLFLPADFALFFCVIVFEILGLYKFIGEGMESTEKGKDSLDIITGAESKVFPPENSNTVDMGEWAEEKE